MRLFKSLTQSARTSESGSHLPPDRLQASHLATSSGCVQAQSGIPSTADCCAYEPIQRLFAVSTSDGRVRIIGTEGVERTLHSASKLPHATKQLAFLYNRGVILRVCDGGNVDLWSTDHLSAHDQGLPLCTLTVKGDAVTVVAPMQRDPYLLLGCASGCVRVAALTNASGSTVTEARQVRNLKLLPYRVEAMQLDSEGGVVQLMTQSEPPVHRFLSVHDKSGAALWDLRAQELVAVVSHRNSKTAAAARNSGHTTSACWLTRTARGDFATGHATGDIIVWALPGPDDLQPRVLAQLRVAPAPAQPVRSLQFVSGRQESLLVFGGQGEDQPDGLVLLPLPEPMLDPEAALGMDDEALEAQLAQRNAQPPARPRKLPWFGTVCAHALVPAQGAITGYEDPVAVLVLMEAGELVVHELGSGPTAAAGAAAGAAGAGKGAAANAPQHFRHALQASPLVTAARLRIIPVGRVPLQGLQGASMTGLREWASTRRAHEKEWTTSSNTPAPTAWQWIVNGGRQAKPDTGAATAVLYCTGHQDGSVRLWDMYGETPMLLGCVPSAAASKALGRAAAAKAVSTIEFAWEQGLLISGHEGGELRVYQYGDHQRRINCVRFESVGAFGGDNAAVAIDEPQGFQLRLMTFIHSADICNSAYDPSSKAVAVSDSAGSVSLIDLSRPSVVWFQAPFSHPVVSLSLAQVPMPSASHRSDALSASTGNRSAGQPVRGVVAVSEDSCVGLLDAATGFLMSRDGALKPKNHSSALHVELLDASGAPLWMARSVRELVDACRTSTSGADTAAAAAAAAAAARRTGPAAPVLAAAPAAQGADGSDDEAGDADLGGGFSAQDLLPYKAGLRGQRATTDSVASADSGSEAGTRGEEGEGAASDEDVDALLARAAAQVEAEDRKSHKRTPKPKNPTSTTTRNPRSPTKGSSSSSAADKARSPSRGRGSPSPDRRPSARSPAQDPPHRAKSKLSGLSTSRSAGSLAGEGSDGGASPQRSSTTAHAAGAHAAGAFSAGAHAAGLIAAGAATGGAPIALADPEAAFALVATREFLRLYTISHLASADRTTAKRVTLAGPLHFASAFVASGAPALVCLLSAADDTQLQVFSLPGLELKLDAPLSSMTGWRWEWNPRTEARLSQVCACTRGGQLALLGPGQELLRLGLAAGEPPPQQAETSYDWDLAAAAHSAALAFERARALGATLNRGKSTKAQRPGQGPSEVDEAAAAAVAAVAAAEAAQREQHESGQRRPKDFIGFMSRIGQDLNKAGADVAKGLQKAIDETHKGMQKVAQVFEEDLPALLAAPAKPMTPQQAAEAAYRHPDLSTIFGTGSAADTADSPSASHPSAGSTGRDVPSGAAVVGANGRMGGGTGGRGAAAYSGGTVGMRPQGVDVRTAGSSGRPGGTLEDANRSELFAASSSSPPASSSPTRGTYTRPGTATTPGLASVRSPGTASSSRSTAAAAGKGGVRTADEIRAAYGRAPAAKANDVANVMAENRQKLAERGERLRALEDKTSDLEESAQGFAEMAKQLAERERNRAKWF